jgi:hypothetical protein
VKKSKMDEMSSASEDELPQDPEDIEGNDLDLEHELTAQLENGAEEEEEEEEDAQNDVGDEGNFYFIFNRSAYKIPSATAEDTPGWIRAYPDAIPVTDGGMLNLLAGSDRDAWMAVIESITTRHIVVVQSKIREEDESLHNTWLVAFEVPSNPCDDRFILRQLPKTVYKQVYKKFAADEHQRESTIMELLPYADNSKSINPALNGFEKTDAPPSARIDKKKDTQKAKSPQPPNKKPAKPGPPPVAQDPEDDDDDLETGAPAKKAASGAPASAPKNPFQILKSKGSEAKSTKKPAPTSPPPARAPSASASARAPSASASAPPKAPAPAHEAPTPAPPNAEKASDDGNKFKRRFTQIDETHEFLLVPETKFLRFDVPAGAKPTSGTAKLVWKFD